ncbi:MAG: methyltransferase type 11, partial [Planctomycetes bacterium]|nr:methyltransferase type 11 [Planctomycetota bacterium]
KVATYKLALFRALCDISLTSYHLAEWLTDDEVGIPVHHIAERWIYYYWPLLEDESNFIPQIRGESRTGRLHIGFRPQLQKLIALYRHAGGLDGFAEAMRSDTFDAAQRSALKALFSKLIPVILSGPVSYAGGSLQTGRLFSYDAEHRQVRVGSEIWRELCLTGHWIQDALILRWAELTSEISRRSLSPSQVIDRLLRIPVRQRNVLDAKRIYLDLPSKECVWSGNSLRRRFDIDHVLPFSLWHNNDLWNLLPASPQANRQKGDSLPTNDLLKRRRNVILDYWEILRTCSQSRFDQEMARFAGDKAPNPFHCFTVLLESVETTAIQRGCLRWEP